MRNGCMILASVLCATLGATALAIDVDTVVVGNPGNPDDTHGVGAGAVDYTYDMGKYEITAEEYTEFLNAVAATDTYQLYDERMWINDFGCKIQRTGDAGSYAYSVASDWAQRPVNFVSWGDSMRFANWLHNGQPTGEQGPGTTEDGSYFVNGAMTHAELFEIERKPEATWVLPTGDEWYKAAYHRNDGVTGNYWDYPTGTDMVPSNDLIDPDPGNNANFSQMGFTIGSPYYRTEVGEFENSASPYGTFDQGGNLWEWTEAKYIDSNYSWSVPAGGCFRGGDRFMSTRPIMVWFVLVEEGYDQLGLRVARVPEPSSLAFLALGLLAVRFRR